jgi:hypothetical protein
MLGKFLSSCTIGGFSRRAQFHGVSLVSAYTWVCATQLNTSFIQICRALNFYQIFKSIVCDQWHNRYATGGTLHIQSLISDFVCSTSRTNWGHRYARNKKHAEKRRGKMLSLEPLWTAASDQNKWPDPIQWCLTRHRSRVFLTSPSRLHTRANYGTTILQ